MDTCDSTWHQYFFPDGDVAWFSLHGHYGTDPGTYIYRVANERGSAIWTKIWARDGKPWTCDACGTALSAEEGGL
jgi:hypothetical protein